jgi:hypothetical protein
MARNAARLKMGFYPLPEGEAARLRALLEFAGPASVVDPCAGQGIALEIITQDADVRRHSVELDAERAAILARPPGGSMRYSALWQADRKRIPRMAPIEFVGRYMPHWFDFAIADELHQLAGDTVQGNGLGVLGRAAKRLIALTGTLMGGYADDLFNIFYRMEPQTMASVRRPGAA